MSAAVELYIDTARRAAEQIRGEQPIGDFSRLPRLLTIEDGEACVGLGIAIKQVLLAAPKIESGFAKGFAVAALVNLADLLALANTERTPRPFWIDKG